MLLLHEFFLNVYCIPYTCSFEALGEMEDSKNLSQAVLKGELTACGSSKQCLNNLMYFRRSTSNSAEDGRTTGLLVCGVSLDQDLDRDPHCRFYFIKTLISAANVLYLEVSSAYLTSTLTGARTIFGRIRNRDNNKEILLHALCYS